MSDASLTGILVFLRAAESLKTHRRSAWTSAGEPESVAEHSWRLSLMALVLAPHFPEVDAARLIKLCIIHDLGEAIGGDVPAPEQQRRIDAGEVTGKGAAERQDLVTLITPLPDAQRAELLALWDEYESAQSAEARLAKALDKLETILQHTQGANPAGFDYRFNLTYGQQHTQAPPLVAALRAMLDAETERCARARESAG
jgi:putative hydrolase of HD superfamily